jgi:hypothetical protein
VKGRTADAISSATRALTYLVRESADEGIVWDLGTYEVLEGSYSKGQLVIYLSGRKLEGEWVLERVDENRWLWKSLTGRVKRTIPSEASALAAVEQRELPRRGTKRAG